MAKPLLPKPGRDRITDWEGDFSLMVTAKGHKSFVVHDRAGRKSRRMSRKAGLSLMEARKEAEALLGAVARGGDPLADKGKAEAAAITTLKVVSEDYLEREAGKLRTARGRKKVFRRLVFPSLGNRHIDEIKRSDIVSSAR